MEVCWSFFGQEFTGVWWTDFATDGHPPDWVDGKFAFFNSPLPAAEKPLLAFFEIGGV